MIDIRSLTKERMLELSHFLFCSLIGNNGA